GGNRFSEKLICPGKVRDYARNSISPTNRQALGCGARAAQHVGPRGGRLPRGRNKTPAALGSRGQVNLPAVDLEPIENLVGPEPLKPMQRLIEGGEFFGVDSANLLNSAHVLLVERFDDIANFTALFGELDAHRAPVNARTLVIEECHLNELLEIVGNIRAEVIAARAQLTGRQFLVPDIIQQQCLHRIYIGAATPIELVLDNVEQPAMKPFDQGQGLQVLWPNVIERRLSSGGLDRLRDGFHVQRPLRFIYTSRLRGPVFLAPDDAPYEGQSKIGLNNTIKIRFICNGESNVHCAILQSGARIHSL